MRILAVRGENIASLASPFEIRLDVEPLLSSRIFAIVGPTGSGKSSILDALCLALFHRTPRLGDRTGAVEIGRDKLKSYDVRGLLHRGQVSAYAECDFEGADGEAYRARWSMRRARGDAFGALQAPQVSLAYLHTGVAIGRTKGEVATAVAERLGLTFEQFRRSVLLAQGDFSAFLRARGEERAALLERMTATPIYARLSVAAHERARDQRRHIELARERLLGLAPLDAETRQGLEQEAALLAKELADHRTREKTLRAEITVFEEDLRLAKEIQALEDDVATKRHALRQAAPRRKALAHYQTAIGFRDLLDGVDRARNQHQERRKHAAAARKRKERAEQEKLALDLQGEQLQEKRRTFDQETANFERTLAAAEALDRQHTQAVERQEEHDRKRQLARQQTEEAESAMDALRKARTSLDEAEAAARQWRQERPYRQEEQGAALALKSIEQAREAADAHRSTQEKEKAARTALRGAENTLKDTEKEAEKALAAAQEARKALAHPFDAQAGTVLRQALRVVEAATSKHALVRSPFEAYGPLHTQWATIDQARQSAEKALQAATEQLSEAEQHRQTAERKEQVAAEALRLGRQRMNALALRKELDEGQPCMVCGATDHPLASAPHTEDFGQPANVTDEATSTTEDLLDELAARHEAALMARKEGQRASREAQQRYAQAQTRLASVAGEAGAVHDRLLSRGQELVAALESLLLTLERDFAQATDGGEPALAQPIADLKAVYPVLQNAFSLAAQPSPPGPSADEVPARPDEIEKPSEEEAGAAEQRTAPPTLPPALDEKLRAMEHGLAERHAVIETRLEGHRKTLAERDQASLALNEISAHQQHTSQAVAEARYDVGHAKAQVEAAHQNAQTTMKRLAEQEGHVRTRCGPDWDDPSFLQALTQEVAEAQSRAEEDGQRAAQGQRLAAQLEAAAATITKARAHQEETTTGWQEQTKRTQALEKERAQLLGGQPTAVARAARAERQRNLNEQLNAHLARIADVESKRRAAEDVVADREELVVRAEAHAQERTNALAMRLADVGLEETSLREVLAQPLDISEEQRALEAMDRALTHATAHQDQRRADRSRLRHQHDALFGSQTQPGLFEMADALPRSSDEERQEREEQLAALAQTITRADEVWVATRGKLAKDDETRTTRQKHEGELEKLRRDASVWEELAGLIGSSDGRRFRGFAQSLTLDILLGRANAQLERLFPRYRIERAPGSDLGLQVADLDMGGVVRSVDTLSGGETFVVSLALALALAGLSAQSVPLRTLFIDEGFGSLDAASLEAVLDVLDTIQAEGKQIGVISHVAEIAERFRVRVHVHRQGDGRSTIRITPPPVMAAE